MPVFAGATILVVTLSLLALVVIGAPLLIFSAHRAQVRQYVEDRGGRPDWIRWAPFRIAYWTGGLAYRVRYRDAAGQTHESVVETRLGGGARSLEDRVVETKPAP